jgi:hypothetical protein
VDHIPQSSEEQKSRDRLQKKSAGQEYANFRDEETFPTFSSLPEDGDINLAFYDTLNGFTYIPQKHWCFLAEIVDVEYFLRLRFIVRDKAGITVPIAFHTEGRGTEFSPFQLQPGYTVAILYAHQHHFLDLTTGVRQEEYYGIKVRHFSFGFDTIEVIQRT